MAIHIERKRGSYGCVREGQGWDTCSVCNSGTRQECEVYMTCPKWNETCRADKCRKCGEFSKQG